MQADIAVVGCGPAGMAAAIAAAEAGASVLVLDEYAQAGGQYFKRSVGAWSVPSQRRTREFALGEALREELQHANVQVLSRALVWGRFEEQLMVFHEGRSLPVQSKALVIATGAYDRPVAFPGWTLPGVMSAGGAQTLAKTQWVKPGQRMLLSGAGPFLLPVSQSLLRADVSIVALVEATHPAAWLPHLGALCGQWPRFLEALDYWRELKRACVPTIYRHKVVRAIGETHVEGAVIAQVDELWRAIPGTERTFEVDAIATGYGLLPSVELAASCGCELRFDPFARTWFVQHSATMSTNKAGIYVAGEITGIGGSAIALEEGRIAGLSAAEFAAALPSDEAKRRREPALRQRARLARFADALTILFGPKIGLWEYLTGDMMVCRCEEVSAGEISECVANGASTTKAVKDWTRAGMGLCQGRMCRGMVSEIVARERGVMLDNVPFSSIRPPIKPVPVAALIDEETTPA